MKEITEIAGVVFTIIAGVLGMVNMYLILALIGASTVMWVIYWLLGPLGVMGALLTSVSKRL